MEYPLTIDTIFRGFFFHSNDFIILHLIVKIISEIESRNYYEKTFSFLYNV